MGIEIAVIYAFLLANPVLIELLVYAAAILIIVSIELGLPQAIAKGIYNGLKAIVNATIWTVTLPFKAVHGLFNALFGKKAAVPAGAEPNDYPQVPPQYAQENLNGVNPAVVVIPVAPVVEPDLDVDLPPGAAPRSGEVVELLPPEAYTLPPEEEGADLPPYTEEYENALPPAYELPAYEDEAPEYEAPEYEEAAEEQRQRVVFAQ